MKIISWNVLNNEYMRWVTDKDSQGLNGSLITDLNEPIPDKPGVTQRDLYVIRQIREMARSVQVIALQECSQPFLNELKQKLPSGWNLLSSFRSSKDQEALLYDKSVLQFKPEGSGVSRTAYPSVSNRPIQQVLFSKCDGTGELSIINAHIPGDPKLPVREEFARYVYAAHAKYPGATQIALGDYNFERDEMIEAFWKERFSEMSFHSPWKTNISPDTKESKAIDHFSIVGPGYETSRDLTPQEVLPNSNLVEMVALLNGA